MTTNGHDLDRGLHTLCYPIDPDSLGDLVLYPLTAEFQLAWEQLAQQGKKRAERDEITPAYASLATALTAATNRPVRLFPANSLSAEHAESGVVALLVTTGVIDKRVMSAAVTRFEQLCADNPESDALAPLLRGVTHRLEPLRSFLHADPTSGALSPPGWLFEAARWNLAARVAAAPMFIDETLPITLRLDTEGSLIAFDNPLSRTSSNDVVGHATIHISTSIITVPGAQRLYLRMDGHVARHPYGWSFVKNTWLDRGDPALPILKLPVLPPWVARGRNEPIFKGYTAEVVESCGLHPIALPAQLGAVPGPVRPIGKPRKHSIGKGPGVRFLYQLGRHATRQLAVEPLRYAHTSFSVGSDSTLVTGPIPVNRIDAAIAATDVRHLRVVCLHATPATRRRMVDALDIYSDAPGRLEGVPDDHPVSLTPRLSAVLHNASSLLSHGTHPRTLDGAPWLDTEPDTAVVVLAETDWDPAAPPKNDAKPAVRRLLAERGIVAQFLSSRRAPIRTRKRVIDGELRVIEPGDAPATAAVRDLFRHAGVFDNRLATATAGKPRAGYLDRDAILVGIHIRQHTPRRRGKHKSPNRLVVRLVALHATPDTDQPWRTTSFSDKRAEWVPYREATADYHATDIGTTELSRRVVHRSKIRDYVDLALTAAKLDRTRPVVIFVDAEACKGIWAGLNDTTFGEAMLPGDAVEHPDIAVVRCATGDRVAQPTHRGHGQKVVDPHQPNLPRATLYEHDEAGTRSWVLAQTSRAYRSSQPDSRAGAKYTRWTVPADKTDLNGKDWHGLTAIEIAPATSGSWHAEHLAALTARLCQQAASWDDRTQAPAPLHLAELADLDHPQRAEDVDDADDS
jgi:hypothetical protein